MTVFLRADQIDWALEKLREGHPVGLPTETVYGLAGLALDEKSLAKIFKIKNRPHFDPLIVHVLDATQARDLVSEVSALQEKLMRNFWPGPLTILFKRNSSVPDLCTAGSDWVAIRSPAHPVFRALLKKLGKALAAPSANRFGRISPTTAEQVVEELGTFGLEAVVDGGVCERGIESTVVKVLNDREIEVLRPGAVSIEKIAECVGKTVEIRMVSTAISSSVEAPGQLASHYAPRTPLDFIEDLSSIDQWKKQDLSAMALLLVTPVSEWSKLGWKFSEILSANSSDTEAASRLFGSLRRLDGMGFKKIVALKTSDIGLGIAINDRLRRAGSK